MICLVDGMLGLARQGGACPLGGGGCENGQDVGKAVCGFGWGRGDSGRLELKMRVFLAGCFG